jgi:RNA polymerase sigma factor (sigma-70 family)
MYIAHVSDLPVATALPASVVADAMHGDAAAFARIVGEYHDDMVRVCRIVLGDGDLAQDATQAAWPIAWQKLRTLRDPRRLRPWLVSIAVNEARQMIRRQSRYKRVTIDVADISSDDHDPASRATDADLLALVRRLSPEDRGLLALRFVAGFDANEIGDILGISASGVRSRLSRLLDRLRMELGDE